MKCKCLFLVALTMVTTAMAQDGEMLPRMHRDELRLRLDSLQKLPPNLRYYEMMGDPELRETLKPMSDSGIRMVGKWGRGPSVKVTGRDSLVFLSLGSEVAIINMRNPALPRVITEVQAQFVVANSVLLDSLLIIGGRGIEVWNIANPANPVHRSNIPVTVSDIRVKDSLLIALSRDSLRIYSLTDAGNPRRLGASPDSGFYLSVSGSYAYVSCRQLVIVDIQNPSNPHRVSSWGQNVESASAKDNFCYVTLYDPMNPGWLRFTVLDVTNPLSIVERGHLNGAGGYDIYPLQWFAYVSGEYLPEFEFQVIDVSNPDWPVVVSRCTTAGWNYGVWADNPFGHAYVADCSEGLAVIDINDPVHPRLDTCVLQADAAQDVVVQSGLAVVADGSAGLRLLDVSDPALPNELGAYDTVGIYPILRAAAVRDSFAFTGGLLAVRMRAIDITNPTHPILAGLAPVGGVIAAIALRDNFAYVAADNIFLIYDIANPRAMRLVGSCRLGDVASGLVLQDSFAYVTGYPALTVLNIARPASPVVVDSFVPPSGAGALGLDVRDTLAFLASDSLRVINIASPRSLFQVCNFPELYYPDDVIVRGNCAYTTSYTANQFVVFDITDPVHAVRLGQHWAPGIRRLFYDGRFVYAACYDAGLCIFDTAISAGISGRPRHRNPQETPVSIWIEPNPVANAGQLHYAGLFPGSPSVNVHDASGRLVKSLRLGRVAQESRSVHLDLSALSPGIYFVSLDGSHKKLTTKVVKR